MPGFGDHFIAHRSQLIKVPDEIPDDIAVLIEPSSVSLHAVLKRPPKEGEKVLVIGAGTIGLNVVQFARAISPGSTIYIMEKIGFKRDLALKLGADHALTGEPYEAVARATGGKPYKGALGNMTMLGRFDLIYDCVGHSNTIKDTLRRLRARGDYVMIGNQLFPATLDQTPIWQQEINISCATGDIITAIAMTESGAGSDLASIRTTAIKDGDYYVINGQKTFISNGINCDLAIVAAKTDPQASPPYTGVSLILVEDGTPGFEKGRNLDKIGFHSQDTAEMAFVDCRVPRENLLGQEGHGFYYLMEELQQERLNLPPLSRQKLGCIKCIFTEPIVGLILPSVL